MPNMGFLNQGHLATPDAASHKDNSSSPKAVAVKSEISRMERAAKSLLRMGISDADYVTRVAREDIGTLASVKDRLSARLRRSRQAPQVVTVQGRGNEPDRGYVIMPIENLASLLESRATAEEDNFVPITQKLRSIGGEAELPLIKVAPYTASQSATSRSIPMPYIEG